MVINDALLSPRTPLAMCTSLAKQVKRATAWTMWIFFPIDGKVCKFAASKAKEWLLDPHVCRSSRTALAGAT